MRLRHRKQQVYELLKRYLTSNSEAPTLREIGTWVGMNSVSGVHRILVALERDGLIKRTRAWKSIEIVEQQSKAA